MRARRGTGTHSIFRYNALHAFQEIGLGAWVHEAGMGDDLMGVRTPAVPLHRWLAEYLHG